MTAEDFAQSFKPVFKTGKRDQAVTNWVAEVDPGLRTRILDQGRIFLEWTACKIKDFTSVSRCCNCQQYGHVGKHCKGKKICSICAQEGHTQEFEIFKQHVKMVLQQRIATRYDDLYGMDLDKTPNNG